MNDEHWYFAKGIPSDTRQAQSPCIAWFGNRLRTWNQWMGVWSIAALQPRTGNPRDRLRALKNRDFTVFGCLIASIVLFILWEAECALLARIFLGVCLYRLVDLIIALLSIGLFGTLRDDIRVFHLEDHRLTRAISCVLLNYVEIMFWFAMIYAALGASNETHFNKGLLCKQQAFFMSMSTMTTVGYGEYAPVSYMALSLATLQALLAVFTVVIVVGMLVGLLGREKKEVVPSRVAVRYLPDGRERRIRRFAWLVVVVIFCVVVCVSWWLATVFPIE